MYKNRSCVNSGKKNGAETSDAVSALLWQWGWDVRNAGTLRGTAL